MKKYLLLGQEAIIIIIIIVMTLTLVNIIIPSDFQDQRNNIRCSFPEVINNNKDTSVCMPQLARGQLPLYLGQEVGDIMYVMQHIPSNL